MIKNIVFDIGKVLVRFDWELSGFFSVSRKRNHCNR